MRAALTVLLPRVLRAATLIPNRLMNRAVQTVVEPQQGPLPANLPSSTIQRVAVSEVTPACAPHTGHQVTEVGAALAQSEHKSGSKRSRQQARHESGCASITTADVAERDVQSAQGSSSAQPGPSRRHQPSGGLVGRQKGHSKAAKRQQGSVTDASSAVQPDDPLGHDVDQKLQCPLCLSANTRFFTFIHKRRYFACGDCALLFMSPVHHLDPAAEKLRYDQHQNSEHNEGYCRFLSILVDAVVPYLRARTQTSAALDDAVTVIDPVHPDICVDQSAAASSASSCSSAGPTASHLTTTTTTAAAVPVPASEAAYLKGLDFGCGPRPVLSMLMERKGFPQQNYDVFYAKDDGLLAASYDFITCSETAEHFNQPAREMRLFDSLLRPGGILGIMTQFAPADEAAFRHWHYIKDPTHVSLYRPATLHFIAQLMNWKLMYCDNKSVVIYQKLSDVKPDGKLSAST